ncbi:MAG: thiamine pyrophosphate-dependent dehydrogenase E1 component subunit alpha [Anaerolineales bacterium]
MSTKKIRAEYDNEETTDVLKKAKELGLGKNDLVEIYATMVEIRLFEEKATELYALGKVHGTMHLSAGQEAVAAGMGDIKRKTDYLLNHHRGHGHFIANGADVRKMMAEFLGKDTGYCRGRGGSMHIADVDAYNLGANGIVGGGIEIAPGVGTAIKMKKTDQVVLVILGDGAAKLGVFHEALNLSAIWDLPIVFLCENNHYAMSAEVERMSSKVPFRDRAKAHGIPGYFIDGNDVLAVHEFMEMAFKHARSGKGPVFVEAETYRYFGHSKSDRNLYRSKEEIQNWKDHGPIKRFRDLLLKADVITEEQVESIHENMAKVIEEAVAYAEKSPEPEVEEVTEWVYA